jgi:CDP-2,3-bis-(O-geranylgeranyl)-sn-glycerol synthase
MHVVLIAQLLFLLAMANGAPIVATRIFGTSLSRPLDNGLILGDGHPFLGVSKTVRGIVAALAATSLLAPVVNVPWLTGLCIAALAMAGDLLSSFIKRRLGLPPSSRFTGLDQIPESLIPAIGGMWLIGLSVYDAVTSSALFLVGEIVLSPLLYRLALRKQPH